MVVVHDFQERCDFGSQSNLPLRHGLLDATRVLLNTSNDAMAIRMLVGTGILAL